MTTGSTWQLRSDSPSFPPELREIDGPPTELWGRGARELLLPRPRVAIVGTRSPSPYGVAQARRFALALAERGVSIVSGLARGIDHTAHAAALEAGGVTLAVLGSGVDRPWPRGPLTERIAREGVLLSELPPGTPPRRHHFPLRNRLIAALGCAVVVIEAAQASGSLITARWAVDQGREVYALPGRVDHPMARGCHRLLREGARLSESPQELLADLGWPAGTGKPARTRKGDGPESPLLAALTGETLGIDELCGRLAKSSSEVLGELIHLELDGRVVRGPGGLFRRA